MAVTDPYPGHPIIGDALDPAVVLAKYNSLFQGVQAFDGSQIVAGSVQSAAFATSINPITRGLEQFFDFVYTGIVWTSVSGLTGTMSSGTIYIQGIRVTATGIGTKVFTLNSDVYVDIDFNGNVTYQTVANNSASPALTANSIRVAIIVTGVASITAFNQGSTAAVLPIASSVAYTVTDSLGNLICPRDPMRKILGYRQITAGFVTSSTTAVQITGLSCPVIIPNSRNIRISLFAQDSFVNGSVVAGSALTIWDGTVGSGTQLQLGLSGYNSGNAAGVGWATILITPTSASKTYNAGLNVNGSGNATIQAGTTSPAWLLTELA